MVEYALLVLVAIFAAKFGISQITRTASTELIQSACVLELGGGTSGTIDESEREGLTTGGVSQREWKACMDSKLRAAGIPVNEEESRPQGGRPGTTAVPPKGLRDDAPSNPERRHGDATRAL